MLTLVSSSLHCYKVHQNGQHYRKIINNGHKMQHHHSLSGLLGSNTGCAPQVRIYINLAHITFSSQFLKECHSCLSRTCFSLKKTKVHLLLTTSAIEINSKYKSEIVKCLCIKARNIPQNITVSGL